MIGDARLPITVRGWVVVREYSQAFFVVDKARWEYAPLEGETDDQVAQIDRGASVTTLRDVNVVTPIRALADEIIEYTDNPEWRLE